MPTLTQPVDFTSLLREHVKEACASGIDPLEVIDGLIGNVITVGMQANIEPEALFLELRERWSTAIELRRSFSNEFDLLGDA